MFFLIVIMLTIRSFPTNNIPEQQLIQVRCMVDALASTMEYLQPHVQNVQCHWPACQKKAPFLCGACYCVAYCCKEHQRLDWKVHKHANQDFRVSGNPGKLDVHLVHIEHRQHRQFFLATIFRASPTAHYLRTQLIRGRWNWNAACGYIPGNGVEPAWWQIRFDVDIHRAVQKLQIMSKPPFNCDLYQPYVAAWDLPIRHKYPKTFLASVADDYRELFADEQFQGWCFERMDKNRARFLAATIPQVYEAVNRLPQTSQQRFWNHVFALDIADYVIDACARNVWDMNLSRFDRDRLVPVERKYNEFTGMSDYIVLSGVGHCSPDMLLKQKATGPEGTRFLGLPTFTAQDLLYELPMHIGQIKVLTPAHARDVYLLFLDWQRQQQQLIFSALYDYADVQWPKELILLVQDYVRGSAYAQAFR